MVTAVAARPYKLGRNLGEDQGAGAVRGAIEAAARRIIGFEMQFGPRRCTQTLAQRKAKQPYTIAMKGGSPFGVAGLWEN
jgi:hypothetical protein